MDISADKYKSDSKHSGLFLAVLHTLRGIVRGLIGFFTLTEEERLKAGVYVSSKWCDG
jgi:hypothetical protein